MALKVNNNSYCTWHWRLTITVTAHGATGITWGTRKEVLEINNHSSWNRLNNRLKNKLSYWRLKIIPPETVWIINWGSARGGGGGGLRNMCWRLQPFYICYSVITCTAPPDLSDLLELYIPSRTFRSSADNCIFHIQDERNLKDSAPFLSLVPLSGTISLSSCDMLQLSFFKSQLKTHLFSVSYS